MTLLHFGTHDFFGFFSVRKAWLWQDIA